MRIVQWKTLANIFPAALSARTGMDQCIAARVPLRAAAAGEHGRRRVARWCWRASALRCYHPRCPGIAQEVDVKKLMPRNASLPDWTLVWLMQHW